MKKESREAKRRRMKEKERHTERRLFPQTVDKKRIELENQGVEKDGASQNVACASIRTVREGAAGKVRGGKSKLSVATTLPSLKPT